MVELRLLAPRQEPKAFPARRPSNAPDPAETASGVMLLLVVKPVLTESRGVVQLLAEHVDVDEGVVRRGKTTRVPAR